MRTFERYLSKNQSILCIDDNQGSLPLDKVVQCVFPGQGKCSTVNRQPNVFSGRIIQERLQEHVETKLKQNIIN